MSMIPASLRRFVIQRAGDRCEYCSLSQAGQAATFHIDHVMPVVANGATVAENLALSCVSCSLRKSARQTVQDPDTLATVPIFHPRQQIWHKYFQWNGVEVFGLTAIGRSTIQDLNLNRAIMLAIRAEEELLGRHPPA
jgi:hypothetical protein